MFALCLLNVCFRFVNRRGIRSSEYCVDYLLNILNVLVSS